MLMSKKPVRPSIVNGSSIDRINSVRKRMEGHIQRQMDKGGGIVSPMDRLRSHIECRIKLLEWDIEYMVKEGSFVDPAWLLHHMAGLREDVLAMNWYD